MRCGDYMRCCPSHRCSRLCSLRCSLRCSSSLLFANRSVGGARKRAQFFSLCPRRSSSPQDVHLASYVVVQLQLRNMRGIGILTERVTAAVTWVVRAAAWLPRDSHLRSLLLLAVIKLLFFLALFVVA